MKKPAAAKTDTKKPATTTKTATPTTEKADTTMKSVAPSKAKLEVKKDTKPATKDAKDNKAKESKDLKSVAPSKAKLDTTTKEKEKDKTKTTATAKDKDKDLKSEAPSKAKLDKKETKPILKDSKTPAVKDKEPAQAKSPSKKDEKKDTITKKAEGELEKEDSKATTKKPALKKDVKKATIKQDKEKKEEIVNNASTINSNIPTETNVVEEIEKPKEKTIEYKEEKETPKHTEEAVEEINKTILSKENENEKDKDKQIPEIKSEENELKLKEKINTVDSELNPVSASPTNINTSIKEEESEKTNSNINNLNKEQVSGQNPAISVNNNSNIIQEENPAMGENNNSNKSLVHTISPSNNNFETHNASPTRSKFSAFSPQKEKTGRRRERFPDESEFQVEVVTFFNIELLFPEGFNQEKIHCRNPEISDLNKINVIDINNSNQAESATNPELGGGGIGTEPTTYNTTNPAEFNSTQAYSHGDLLMNKNLVHNLHGMNNSMKQLKTHENFSHTIDNEGEVAIQPFTAKTFNNEFKIKGKFNLNKIAFSTFSSMPKWNKQLEKEKEKSRPVSISSEKCSNGSFLKPNFNLGNNPSKYPPYILSINSQSSKNQQGIGSLVNPQKKYYNKLQAFFGKDVFPEADSPSNNNNEIDKEALRNEINFFSKLNNTNHLQYLKTLKQSRNNKIEENFNIVNNPNIIAKHNKANIIDSDLAFKLEYREILDRNKFGIVKEKEKNDEKLSFRQKAIITEKKIALGKSPVYLALNDYNNYNSNHTEKMMFSGTTPLSSLTRSIISPGVKANSNSQKMNLNYDFKYNLKSSKVLDRKFNINNLRESKSNSLSKSKGIDFTKKNTIMKI